MKATETQINYLQAVDPLVRRALRDPDFDFERIRDIPLRPNQKEAIERGWEERFQLFKGLDRAMKEIWKMSEKDRELARSIISSMREEKPEPPLEYVQLREKNPRRARRIAKKVRTLVGALHKVEEKGYGSFVRRYLEEDHPEQEDEE